MKRPQSSARPAELREALAYAEGRLHQLERSLADIRRFVVALMEIVQPTAEQIIRAARTAQGIEAAAAGETGTGSTVGESPVAASDAP